MALRQTEGLIGSIIALLGLDFAAPDHVTLCRRAENLAVVGPRLGSGPVHLPVDSTGMKLCGCGAWLLEKHVRKTRRSRRKLHIAVDVDTGQIAAAAVTSSDVDDTSPVGALLNQVAARSHRSPPTALTIRTAFCEVTSSHPEASIIVPPRSSTGPSETAETASTIRYRYLQMIGERGRMAW